MAMILVHGLTSIAVGLLLGGIVSFWSTRLVRQFLFDLEDFDLIAYTGAAMAFGVVGLAACYVPARRAARLDVLSALRQD